jgi:hypothetical protein
MEAADGFAAAVQRFASSGLEFGDELLCRFLGYRFDLF